ncbi:UDP-glucuronic acid decarboxylase family protein [Bradyrhizobium centrolobii]|uniref:UDP-glucuronic acid decarboxylase family protein n=1 Tax=Bradyrhizobium centrolobii TaxID=1505087 RepID=UPI0009ECEDB1|nr:UDP-glucuronic acid decarboxylase family protein [Bradyrhizobium centrolobii]
MPYNLAQRILVTGGSGFLGSHLCERLLANGAEVLCVDNFFTGTRGNVEHLLDHHRFELLRHDVTFPLYVEVDQIYNLACPASPVHYQHDPVQTTKTSVIGAINMLGLAKRLKVSILQASTSEVYGDPTVHPQTEDYWGNVNPIGPRSCYDEGKRCAETLFFDYRRQHRLAIKVARIFNTYGPRMHPNDGRVISNFIVQALRGHDITIYGDGLQSRAFCYVDDLIDGLMRLMQSSDDVTGPLNLGNPNEVTMRELAELTIELTGSRSNVVHRPLPQDDPRQRQPDISHANALLGWAPQVSLRQGLARTIAYFEGVLTGSAREPSRSHAASSDARRLERAVPG